MRRAVLALAATVLVACGGAVSSSGDRADDDPGRAADSDGAEITIERVQTVSGQSYPVQVRLLVEGSVTDACGIAEPELERTDHRFTVELRPEQVGECSGRQSFSESILLPTHDLEKGTYEVVVDGEVVSFTVSESD